MSRSDASHSATGTDPDEYGITGYSAVTYGESFADVYDEWYENLDDLDFVSYVAASLPARKVRVLELGVGTGRLLAHLLQLRTEYSDDIVGVDASPLMLNHAARRAFPSRVKLVESDFSTSLPDGTFDCIFVGYNTIFNLPSVHALRACLALIATRLAPDGFLHIDAVSPLHSPQSSDDGQHASREHLAPHDHIGSKVLSNGERVLSLSTHDPAHQRITGQFIQFDSTGHPTYRPWSVHYETPAQLDALAHEAGLHLVSRCGDSVGQPFTEESSRHISTYALSTQ